jgi:hypothetical protein
MLVVSVYAISIVPLEMDGKSICLLRTVTTC